MKTTNALLNLAAQTIEDLVSFVETTYTDDGGTLPDDVAKQLMTDRDLVRQLRAHEVG